MEGVEDVKKNIRKIYDRRKAACLAICLKWAATALNYFRSVQSATPNSHGQFWNNKTAQAALRVFSGGDILSGTESDIIRWFMAHGVHYGVYLELANDRAHEALRPIINRYAGRFFKEIRELYGEESAA